MIKLRSFATFLLIISTLWSAINAVMGIQKRDWYVTTATIDKIGLPDGAVFGTYTDQDGEIISKELFISTFMQNYDSEGGKYIGSEVKIQISSETGEIVNFTKTLVFRWCAGGLLAISVLLLIYTKNVQNRRNTK